MWAVGHLAHLRPAPYSAAASSATVKAVQFNDFTDDRLPLHQ
jgi:hypothetical protein